MSIEVQNIQVFYDNHAVLRQVSFRVNNGEILALLGPSGSGKTTLLLAIAGLLPQTAEAQGGVLLNGQDISRVPALKRNLPLVFQNYALFPNMTVYGNIAFPLRVRKLPEKEINKQTWEIMDLLHIADKSSRHPRELSGGEQQRVALGRSLILKPSVMLLDEPVGALDKHLREGILEEIKKLRRELGITMIYVTHDQSEALYLANTIAVLKEGVLQQVGPSTTVYSRPSNVFVARFLGSINLIPTRLKALSSGIATFVTSSGLEFPSSVLSQDLKVNKRYFIGIRPENVVIANRDNAITGVVEEVVFIGGIHRYGIRLKGISELLISNGPAGHEIKTGDKVNVSWSQDNLVPLQEELPDN